MPLRKSANAIKTKIEQGQQEQLDQKIPAGALRDQIQPINLGPRGDTGSGYTPNPDAVTRIDVRKNSTGAVYSRRRLNLIEGSGATITLADDSGNEEIDITVAASGSGALTVEEVDGSPTDSAVTKIIFPNGTLTIASHEATYTPAGGGSSVIGIGATGSRPASPATGELYLDTTLGREIIYDGTLWRLISPYIRADTILYDSFDRTLTLDGSYTEYGFRFQWQLYNAFGSASVNSSGQWSTAFGAIYGLNVRVATYTVEFDAISVPSGDGVYCRHSGGNNQNGLGIRNNAGTWEWWKTNASAGSTSIAYAAGQHVKIVVTATALTLTIGASSHTLTDSTYNTQTYFVSFVNSGPVVIDNLLIY